MCISLGSKKAIVIKLCLMLVILCVNVEFVDNAFAFVEIKSKTDNTSDYDGIYVYDNAFDKKEEIIGLVLSHDGKQLPAISNDPSAPRNPGFYPYYYGSVFGFNSLKISETSIEFQTHTIKGVSYIFKGTSAKEFDDEFNMYFRFIEGTLTKLVTGKVAEKRKIKFSIVRVH